MPKKSKNLNDSIRNKGYFVIKNFINKKKIKKLKIAISNLFLKDIEFHFGKSYTFKNKNNLWDDKKFCALVLSYRKNYPLNFSKLYNLIN